MLFLNRKMIGIGTLISPVVQSFTMEILDSISIHSNSVILNLCLMFLGIVIISVGCALYSNADLGCSPYIGAIQAITHKTKIGVGWIKTMFDGGCLIGAIILSKYPSIGPVVSVLISGYVMQVTENSIKKYQYLYKF